MTEATPKAFHKNNMLSIIFETQMVLTGEYNILTSSNFNFFNGISYSSLENFIEGIFSYSDFHVTYILKENYLNLNLNLCSLQFFLVKTTTCLGVTSYDDSSKLTSINSQISTYFEDLSISNFTVTSYYQNSILITLKENTYLSRIYFNDFFILKNNYTYSISSANMLSGNKFILEATIPLFDSLIDIISIHTSSHCNSKDIFGDTLYTNESAFVLNLQENEITNVSITSILDNTLELTSRFKFPLIRYDCSDFEIILDDITYPLVGHSSHSLDLIKLNCNTKNINLTPNSEIFLKGKKNLLTYTLDNRFIQFSNETKVKAKLFYATSGEIFYSIDSLLRDYIRISVNFNKDILETSLQNYYEGILSYDIYLKCLKIDFPRLSTLYIYADNLETFSKEYSLNCLVHSYKNTLELFFSISSYNFLINNLSKISLFSLDINSCIESIDNTLALSSFYCPLKEVIKTPIRCKKEDEGETWRLLNKETNSDIILLLHTQKEKLYYGNEEGITYITGDVYIMSSSSNYGYTEILVFLTNLNIKGNIYLLTNDIFNFNFINCNLNNLFIYN